MHSIPLILAGLALVVPQATYAQGPKLGDIPQKCLAVCAPFSNAQSLCTLGFDNAATRMACLCKDSTLHELARCLTCEADPSVPLPAGSTRPTLHKVQKVTDVIIDVCYDLGLIVHPIHITIPKQHSTKPPQTGSGSGAGSGAGSGCDGDDDDDDKPTSTAAPKPTSTSKPTVIAGGAGNNQTPLTATAAAPKPTPTKTATATTTTTSTSASTVPTPKPSRAAGSSDSTSEFNSAEGSLASKIIANKDGLEDDDDGPIANASEQKDDKKKTSSAGRSTSVHSAPYLLAAAAMVILTL